MTEQKFVYVDVDYLKELEETAKKVDYYKGIIDGIMMCKDEPQTHDIRTNTHECVKDTHDKTEPTISKIEQVDKDINVRSKDEPQYDIDKGTIKCDNCSENGSYKCTKCDGEMYFKRLEVEDEPQTDCAWK